MKYPVYLSTKLLGHAEHEFEAVLLFNQWLRDHKCEDMATNAYLGFSPCLTARRWQLASNQLGFNGTTFHFSR